MAVSALAVWVMPDAPVVPVLAFMLVSGVLLTPDEVVAFMPVLVVDGVVALMSGVAAGAGAVAVLAASGVVAADGAGAVC